jgi:hypothetical protein
MVGKIIKTTEKNKELPNNYSQKKFYRSTVVQIKTSELSWVNSDLGEKVQIPVDPKVYSVIPDNDRASGNIFNINSIQLITTKYLPLHVTVLPHVRMYHLRRVA